MDERKEGRRKGNEGRKGAKKTATGIHFWLRSCLCISAGTVEATWRYLAVSYVAYLIVLLLSSIALYCSLKMTMPITMIRIFVWFHLGYMN